MASPIRPSSAMFRSMLDTNSRLIDLTREDCMADVTIETRPNGPYVVTGTIELHDTNGNVIPTQARTVLCRCGASTKKPFCDEPTQRSASKPRHKRYLTQLKPQIPALRRYLQEPSGRP